MARRPRLLTWARAEQLRKQTHPASPRIACYFPACRLRRLPPQRYHKRPPQRAPCRRREPARRTLVACHASASTRGSVPLRSEKGRCADIAVASVPKAAIALPRIPTQAVLEDRGHRLSRPGVSDEGGLAFSCRRIALFSA